MGLQTDMKMPPIDPNVFQRALQRIGATGLGTAVFAPVLNPLDRFLHRLSRGRTTVGRSLGALPVVMLTTIGARSGREVTTPINVIPFGEDLALVGTNYGRGTVPAWGHNLRANPAAVLAYGDGRYEVVAREIEGALYEEVFSAAAAVYAGYSRYRRVASNDIPIFILAAKGTE